MMYIKYQYGVNVDLSKAMIDAIAKNSIAPLSVKRGWKVVTFKTDYELDAVTIRRCMELVGAKRV